MASKRRNSLYRNKNQETTEKDTCNLPPFCVEIFQSDDERVVVRRSGHAARQVALGVLWLGSTCEQALMDVIRQELKNLLDHGIIRKSISPYCSPLWMVPKPPIAPGNPRRRVVVDYKELNKHTHLEKYPLPKVEDMLDRMDGASVFSILDLKAGYHQIRMHESDCEKTAFQFERGNYEFTRMPFGLNIPSSIVPGLELLRRRVVVVLDPPALEVPASLTSQGTSP
ncbi:hypothetical protein AAG570_002077 [Ranatra chinensis]|uniref:Reverse transcriptase domain-containing protein n=1 Tax=Ranatra chinensis TaxID=642074 RepID=A0ABD0YCA3_9HEMI